jgi:potassium efflux system protein
VGDIVTIDNISGVISRIGTRATVLTNWERKEFIVPNKELITGKLLNWTLSDSINRIAIEVGMAYGTDTTKACALLLEIANNHPYVLKNPAPLATFEGFGDSSLRCILRVFLPSTEKRLEVIHQLHTAIDETFRKEKIDIACPQHEVYIREEKRTPRAT